MNVLLGWNIFSFVHQYCGVLSFYKGAIEGEQCFLFYLLMFLLRQYKARQYFVQYVEFQVLFVTGCSGNMGWKKLFLSVLCV